MREGHSGEYEVAELPRARFDDGRVVVAHEDVAGDEGAEEPYGRRCHRYYGLDVAPQRVLHRYHVAGCGNGGLYKNARRHWHDCVARVDVVTFCGGSKFFAELILSWILLLVVGERCTTRR